MSTSGTKAVGLKASEQALHAHADASPTGKEQSHKTCLMYTVSVVEDSATATVNAS